MSARPWQVLLFAVAAAALAARLGFWQLDRAQQKRAVTAQIKAQAQQPALPQSALARDDALARQQDYRTISLRGRWLAQRSVYLDNRPLNGQAGFIVVTPLLIGEGDAVLVQRGWTPRHMRDRLAVAPLYTPQGEVTVEGRIAPWPARLMEFGGPDDARIRQNLGLEAFAREIGVALRPLSVQQSAGTAAAADGLIRQWALPTLDPSNNYGYAFQWFALSALITGLYVWYQVIRPRRHARQ